ncbi:MAG: hypothetical protein Q4B70_06500 [Lachnospiraceae bacterium]|nr:hypothetical protein [Lachnospiraceae bacterium]
MKEDRLDQWIRETVKEESNKISVPNQKETILTACKMEKNRSRFQLKKAAALVAVLCILCTGTALAGGKVVSLIGLSSPDKNVTKYEQTKDLEKKAGIDAVTVKQFKNGFQFTSAGIVDVAGKDENENTVEKYKEVSVEYGKGKQAVSLSLMSAAIHTDSYEKWTQTNYKDILLYSTTDHYKFVPVDYEPTKEELEAEKNGELYLSYGTDEIEEEDYVSVCWEKDGVSYSLHTMNRISESILINMAEELIENGK